MSFSTISAVVLLACATGVASTSAFAQVIDPSSEALPGRSASAMRALVGADDVDVMMGELQDLGFRARRDVDSGGAPIIRSASSGVNFQVYFYGCDESGTSCNSIQFYAGFNTPDEDKPETMNDWNRRKRFASAFIDSDGEPALFYDLMLGKQGLPVGTFREGVEMWDEQLGAFLRHIDW